MAVDGGAVGHLIDPRDGRAAEPSGSVTVLTRDAAMADALATGFAILGRSDAMARARALDGVDVIVVDATGIHTTLVGESAPRQIEEEAG